MVRLRNIQVHDYMEVDSTTVYRNLTGELEGFDQFARQIIGRFLPQA